MSAWATDNKLPVFIQWKGTEVCMDFHCPFCKTNNHYDADFAYFIRCGGCLNDFELSTGIDVRMLPNTEKPTLDPVEPYVWE